MIFAGYIGSKNLVWNRLKIQFVELDFSYLIFQKLRTDQQGESLVGLGLTLKQKVLFKITAQTFIRKTLTAMLAYIRESVPKNQKQKLIRRWVPKGGHPRAIFVLLQMRVKILWLHQKPVNQKCRYNLLEIGVITILEWLIHF